MGWLSLLNRLWMFSGFPSIQFFLQVSLRVKLTGTSGTVPMNEPEVPPADGGQQTPLLTRSVCSWLVRSSSRLIPTEGH
jgi:hypothetical protein